MRILECKNYCNVKISQDYVTMPQFPGDLDKLERDGEVAAGWRRTGETFKQRDIEVRRDFQVEKLRWRYFAQTLRSVNHEADDSP